DAKIDTGMRLGKMAEPMHQPLGRKVGRRADGQDACILALKQALGADRNAVQSVAHDVEIIATGLRDNQALAFSIEQLDSKPFFKSLHLLTYRTLRDAELFSSPRKALVPGGSLERSQIVQCRQTRAHRSTSLVKLGQARESMICRQRAG